MDGYRYDLLSLVVQSSEAGWRFCQDLTGTVRFAKPEAVQITEYWPVDAWTVRDSARGGAGLDASWDDGLRSALRAVADQASWGQSAFVDLDRVAATLRIPAAFEAAWKAMRYIESHDEVRWDTGARIPVLADRSDPHSWYARSRARVLTGILLTAPGIPMLFMGQEMLESAPWRDSGPGLDWIRQDTGPGRDFLRFTSDLVRVRRQEPALRGDPVNVFHVDTRNRVLACHRWLESVGADVVVLASLNETTLTGYRIGMPRPGRWTEILNSDAYDNWLNPWVAGNAGAAWADHSPLHDLPYSTGLTIPANSILILRAD